MDRKTLLRCPQDCPHKPRPCQSLAKQVREALHPHMGGLSMDKILRMAEKAVLARSTLTDGD